MAHGTDQAILGLGDGSDAPNGGPVATGADNRLETLSPSPSAANVTADSTTLAGVGTNVQAVLEELDDAIAAVASSAFTENVLAADQSLTAAQVDTGLGSAAGAAADVIELEGCLYFTGITNGETVQLTFTGGASGVVYCDEGSSSVGVGTTVVGDHSTTYAVTVGATDHAVFRFAGRIVATNTPAIAVLVGKASGANGALKKGSYVRVKRHAA